jgi:uroporphyrinogen-III synthase
MKSAALYLGLDPTNYHTDKPLIHCPLIQILPRNPDEPDIKKAFKTISMYTHLLITSKSALKIFIDYLPLFGHSLTSLADKQFIAVGQVTSEYIQRYGFKVSEIPTNECSEGLISEVLPNLPKTTHLFWPHSAQSRSLLNDFLMTQPYRHQECHLYDTLAKEPYFDINMHHIDEIIFTSPSTVDAYIHFFGILPRYKILTAIGPVTRAHLQRAPYYF